MSHVQDRPQYHEFWNWPKYWNEGQLPEVLAKRRAEQQYNADGLPVGKYYPPMTGIHFRLTPTDEELAQIDTPVLRANPHLRDDMGFMFDEFYLGKSKLNFTSIEDFVRATEPGVRNQESGVGASDS